MTSFAVKSNGMSNSQQMPPTTTSYFNPLYAQDLNENSNTGANGCNGGNRNYLKAPESNVAASSSSSSYSNQNPPVTKATENGVDSFQMAKNKFSGTDLANYNSNNKPNRAGGAGGSGGGVLPNDPLVSGVTRIYINHVSSSNNVSEKIKDVNQKTTLMSSGNSLIKLTQDSSNNSNAAKVETNKKDNSTSPIKIYASSTSSSRLENNENKKELKTNYSDFDLIAQPKTQDAFTQIEMSQIAETGVQKKPSVNENSSGNYQDTQKEEYKTNMNVTKQVEFKSDMHGQMEKKSKIHLEKSKTVIVNVTPQKQDNEPSVETSAAVERAAAMASEAHSQSDSKYPASKLVSNLKKLMDFKAATSNDSVTTQNLSSNTNAKEVYVDESKYDMKNDSTPVSITSNVNKPNKQVTIAPVASTSTTNTNNAMDRMNSDSHILPQMRVNNYNSNNNNNNNIPLNQNIFPTQSSSYYNDVNNRNPMSASQEGGIDDIGTRTSDNRLSSEVIIVHDETKSSSSNQSYTRNPFLENQITNQFESDTTSNVAPVIHNPVMTFYNGSKVWTTTISNDGTTQHVIDNQKVERVTEKSKHATDEQPATAPPSAKVKESNLQKSRSNSMRKNLKVKIKLPIENMAKIPPKKERKIQKCCLVLFLLILFILATGILIYFFASGFIMKRTAL